MTRLKDNAPHAFYNIISTTDYVILDPILQLMMFRLILLAEFLKYVESQETTECSNVIMTLPQQVETDVIKNAKLKMGLFAMEVHGLHLTFVYEQPFLKFYI